MRYFSLLLCLIILTLRLVPVVPVFAASNILIPPAANSAGDINNSRNVLNESSFSISKLSNGQDLNILSIDSIPSALDGDPEIRGFVSYMFYFLFSLGIVLSFLEGYISELNGRTYSYYGLFFRTALIVAGFLSWRQIGITNFAQAKRCRNRRIDIANSFFNIRQSPFRINTYRFVQWRLIGKRRVELKSRFMVCRGGARSNRNGFNGDILVFV